MTKEQYEKLKELIGKSGLAMVYPANDNLVEEALKCEKELDKLMEFKE